MKKRTKILTILVILCVALFVAAACLLNDIFPKATPMAVPDPADLISATLRYNSTNVAVAVNQEDYESLLQHLGSGIPTRRQAMNDTPTVQPHYCAEIQTEDRWYCFFVYEEDGQVYIEIPYEGIYESDMVMLDLVLRYFEEE